MRDAWAGSFHELLTLQQPRTDAPMHLPDGPPLFEERERRRRRRRLEQQGVGSGQPAERHCSAGAKAAAAPTTRSGAGGGECAAAGGAAGSVTRKQRNRIQVFASMTHTPPPSEAALATMTKEQAAQWLHARWTEWVHHGLAEQPGPT